MGVPAIADWTRHYRAVKKILDRVDAEGLLAMGAPKDEYKREAITLATMIARGETITGARVRDVWLYWFGTSTDAHGTVSVLEMPMRPAFTKIAARISAAKR